MARQVPSCGRVVHFVTTANLRFRYDGEHRPAFVIRAWDEKNPDSALQLQVFIDRLNDGLDENTVWATSVTHDETEKKPGTWHWPEFVPPVE